MKAAVYLEIHSALVNTSNTVRSRYLPSRTVSCSSAIAGPRLHCSSTVRLFLSVKNAGSTVTNCTLLAAIVPKTTELYLGQNQTNENDEDQIHALTRNVTACYSSPARPRTLLDSSRWMEGFERWACRCPTTSYVRELCQSRSS